MPMWKSKINIFQEEREELCLRNATIAPLLVYLVETCITKINDSLCSWLLNNTFKLINCIICAG